MQNPHSMHFVVMEDNDAILDLDRLLPAVVGAGAATGAEPGVPDRSLDTGDPDLVEPLALAAVGAGGDGDPDLDREFLAEELLIDLLCKAHAVDDTELAVPGPEAGGDIHHFFPLGTERCAVRFEIIEQPFESVTDPHAGTPWSGGW